MKTSGGLINAVLLVLIQVQIVVFRRKKWV